MNISSYKDIKNFTNECKLPFDGVNDNDESILISSGIDNESNEKYYKVKTKQNNGWIRTNIYWEDGTIEELYEK